MISCDVLFNMPAAKQVNTRQFPIIWIENDEE